MALIYTLDLIFKSDNINQMLDDFNSIVISESRKEKFKKIKKWEPKKTVTYGNKTYQEGIKGFGDGDFRNCLVLSRPYNPEFIKYMSEVGYNHPKGVGCVYPQLIVTKNWGILSLVAAVSSISLIFEHPDFQHHIIEKMKPSSEVIILNKYDSYILYPFLATINNPIDSEEYYFYYDKNNELEIQLDSTDYYYGNDELEIQFDWELYLNDLMMKIRSID